MSTKAPTRIRQYPGESLLDLVIRAANQAVIDDGYVVVDARLMDSGAELRVTRENTIEMYAKQGLAGGDETTAHDSARVVEASCIAECLLRGVRVFCSNHLDVSVHIMPGLSTEAALAAYRECFHVRDNRTDI